MPLLALLLIACQVFCGLHVVRSGQERYWIYLIIALPGLGCLIYALGIMLPDLLRSRRGRRAVNQLQDRLDPERHLRALRNDLEISDTRETRMRLADELLRLGQAAEAVEHYRAALRGIHAQAPDILLGLARAQLANGEAAACRLSLEQLREHNPDFRSADGHLLYAQALAQLGETLKAEEEYRALLGYFAGPEAPLHYALLLKQLGRSREARELLEQIDRHARRAPKHYRNLHQTCLAQARSELQELRRPLDQQV
ncbi:tetratricopeptide repeat protein [Pseudomonas sp. L-22-4S-12]|uniref:tetratricopeptide repeat protein n=1 Tax=Pseudomonas sp. L-22-4S-12 TaxID=2610893 RepID=UPI001329B0B8|nr:tetratricopeptide repeat protein [Pseudomonas sp. L-22-4S-12]MWV15503.1 tetratricopeptide repeat protein [Pseudomonas sp. L-22-4S-12]